MASFFYNFDHFSRYIAVHEINASLGPARSLALPFFYALMGCDSTSSFYYHPVKRAWNVWLTMPGVTNTFCILSGPRPSLQIVERCLRILEEFVCKVYDVPDDIKTLNEARAYLFLHKKKSFDRLPPTSDAFKLHVLRSVHQVF